MERTNVLIFTFDILGHHLEYTHHLYEKYRREGVSCVFVVPERFLQLKSRLIWEDAPNIRFDFITDAEERRYDCAGTLKKRWLLTGLLRRKIRETNPEKVFCLYLTPFTLFSFLLPRRSRVSGIVYQIPLYAASISFPARLRNFQEFTTYANSRKFSRIYVLNDMEGAAILNRKYRTEKFIGLPDPYFPLKSTDSTVRAKYGIPEDGVLFLHLGQMTESKGTTDVLRAIASLAPEEADRYWFFFAGKVGVDIRDRFYSWIEDLRGSRHLIVVDEFCEFSFFADLCLACDALVIPYHRTSQSSGIIGYASQFGKPVIAPGSGLLGQLIRRYSLGYLLPEVSEASIREGFRAVAGGQVPAPTQEYCRVNTVHAFMDTIQE